MSLLEWGKAQFIEIIQWLDDSDNLLAWRFPVRNQQIKQGAQLVVRQSQAAVFVNEGRLADVFGPGTHTLSTKNLPILADLQGWKYGFESPFKAEVYFINTRLYNDMGWGTANPVMMRDPDFGVVRVRAHGIYSFRVNNPPQFLTEIVGTNEEYTKEEIAAQLRKTILSCLTDTMVESKVGALDLNAQLMELADAVRQKMDPEFNTMGLQCSKLIIENFDLPEEVQQMLDKRTGVGIMAPVMGAYTQMQVANSIPLAAENPSGVAGLGMGLGVGLGMGNMMGNQMGAAMTPMQQMPYPQGMGQPGVPGGPAAPMAPAAPTKTLKEELMDLKDLFDSQLITQTEFDAQRAAIMKKHGMG